MSLGIVPMKPSGGVKWYASLELGAQVSMAIQRAATTTRNRHTEKLNRDTYHLLARISISSEVGGRPY